MERLILASASPRRKYLLKKAKIPFRVIIPHVSEKTTQKTPQAIVKELALRKACAVAQKFSCGIVLGADTMVVVKGKIIGKPRNEKDAYRILKLINGKRNDVYTGIALVNAQTKKTIVDYEKSIVFMKNILDKRIQILAHKHLDKAGAYAIQEKKDAFVKKVIGDYTNVVGLPIPLLKTMLKNLSI